MDEQIAKKIEIVNSLQQFYINLNQSNNYFGIKLL